MNLGYVLIAEQMFEKSAAYPGYEAKSYSKLGNLAEMQG